MVFGLLLLWTLMLCGLTVTTGTKFFNDTDTRSDSKSSNIYYNKENSAVTNFREFLRINTAHPNPDYDNAIQWLRKQAVSIGLEFKKLQFKKPDLFAVWLTWRGSDPSLQSILLNSHMDVVAANPQNWIHDPFGAYKDEHGNIYARGSLDMKSSIVSRLEAIRTLKNEGFVPLRTVHVSIMPDEEIGGMHGMKPFVNSKQFKNLNVGFDLDEGSGSRADVMSIDYGQKAAWQIEFTAPGISGHGASLSSGTAGEKIQIVIDRLMEFRKQEKDLMENTPGFGSSDVTTVNLVKLGGGVANNILPDSLWAVFDIRIRIRPNWNFTDMENFLNKTCEEAGEGVTYKFYQKSLDSAETPLDETNVWWMNMKATFDQMNWKYQPKFLGATSDARHVRSAGILALGFNTAIESGSGGIHGDNEYLNENVFLSTIGRYVIVLRNLTQLPANNLDYAKKLMVLDD